MARQTDKGGIKISGKVGNIVGATWRGMDIIRSAPTPSKKPPTKKQQTNREKFAAAVNFLQPLRHVVSEYFGNADGVKSRYNQALSWCRSKVVVEDEAAIQLLWNRAMFAKGELMQLKNGRLEPNTEKVLRILWDDNSDQGNAETDDILHLIVYPENSCNVQYFETETKRTVGIFEKEVSEFSSIGKAAVYVFFTSKDRKLVSNSEFLGTIDLK